MPHVTFIYPCVGRFTNTRYVRSWQMQPLSIAILSSLTPPTWDRRFFDDRLETIDYNATTDLVAISVETYTARRSYQIAAEYRSRGVPVVMGGYHPTACPGEAKEHADAICVGDGEGVWPAILEDAQAGRLAGVYEGGTSRSIEGIRPDRQIFRGKDYFKIALVETGRGCPFMCDFCSVTAFHKATYRRRPINDIIEEIRELKEKRVFFVDDNVIGETAGAKELFRALIPLRIQWISQASIHIASDPELLDLAAESGCLGLLIGFESLNPANLRAMGKSVNLAANFEKALAELRKRGILMYGSFLFGFPDDSEELVRKTVRFAQAQKMYLAAFAHLVPFPGTPLYDTCAEEGRLTYDRWWLSEEFRFGEPPFRPPCVTAEGLQSWCYRARKRFYRIDSILRRAFDFSANCGSLPRAAMFFTLNLLLRREISQKSGLPLGVRDCARG